MRWPPPRTPVPASIRTARACILPGTTRPKVPRLWHSRAGPPIGSGSWAGRARALCGAACAGTCRRRQPAPAPARGAGPGAAESGRGERLAGDVERVAPGADHVVLDPDPAVRAQRLDPVPVDRAGVRRRTQFLEQHVDEVDARLDGDRKSTRLNSSHVRISYAVFCLKKKKKKKK